MNAHIKHFLTIGLTCLLIILAGCTPGASDSSPESYPSKTITIICPWSPGGGTDRLTRFMADQLQKELGKPCVVVNRTGGSGAVGHSAGALAKPDGHTLTMATFELSTMNAMGISDLTWKNYTPILQINADAAAIMVRTDSPWQSLDDLLAHIRANSGKLTMSGTSTGGLWDLARAGLQLKSNLPIESVRWIPSKGSAPAIVELLGGHVDSICCSVPEAFTQIEAGQMRALAVMAPERLVEYPEIPTVQEASIDWSAVGWRGILAPANTPEPIAAKLQEACSRIIESESFKEFTRKNGFATKVRTGDAFTTFLKEQESQWIEVIEAAGYAK